MELQGERALEQLVIEYLGLQYMAHQVAVAVLAAYGAKEKKR